MTTHSVSITLDVESAIRKPIEGQGGFQDLLRKLQGQLNVDSSVLAVTDEDIERIVRYKTYEPGGFEERLAPVLELLRQQGLIQ